MSQGRLYDSLVYFEYNIYRVFFIINSFCRMQHLTFNSIFLNYLQNKTTAFIFLTKKLVVGEHKPKCRIAVQEFRVRKYALGLRIGLESRLGLALTLNLNFGSVILHLSQNFKKQN